MKTMRVNYTNVGIAISTLAVLYIFYLLVQRRQSVTSQAPVTTVLSSDLPVRDEAKQLALSQLEIAKETILSLKKDLADALKENTMEFGKKKFEGQKLVHLDLKGAPTKMEYLIQVLPFFSKWGATGLLVEYEDTFPYEEEFKVLQAKNAYSVHDIENFLGAAKENDLTVIPLVQTFGHLEFVLKHVEFSNLRETPHYTNSLCPNNKDSVPMVIALIDQVLSLHPGVEWFHIGGDEKSSEDLKRQLEEAKNDLKKLEQRVFEQERAVRKVWNLKTCPVCVKDERNKSALFVKHMTPILKHLKSKGVTPIMWDDMMRTWNVGQLKELGSLVEPMVWAYRSDLTGFFPLDMWERYSEAFSKIWTASAFKGATRPWSNFVPIGYHVQNNLMWLDIIAKLPPSTQVTGLALTGWSRYDHYATLCELLPAALPSLAFCLQALREGYMDDALRQSTAKDLGFPSTFSLNVNRFTHYYPPDGNFPGHEVYKLVGYIEKATWDVGGVFNIEHGWMLNREVEDRFLSFYQMEVAYNKTVHGLQLLTSILNDAESALVVIYDEYVVKEWVKDKIEGPTKYLNTMKTRLEELKTVAAESSKK